MCLTYECVKVFVSGRCMHIITVKTYRNVKGTGKDYNYRFTT